jgi:hypothetical protein
MLVTLWGLDWVHSTVQEWVLVRANLLVLGLVLL